MAAHRRLAERRTARPGWISIGAISFLAVLFGDPATAQHYDHVVFTNASAHLLRCMDARRVPFLRVNAGESAPIDNLRHGSVVRCYTNITDRATTVLTDFTIDTAGEYVFRQKWVPCSPPTCKTADSRPLTVVTLPNGQTIRPGICQQRSSDPIQPSTTPYGNRNR